MDAKKRFLIGGAGALMPILVTLMSVDIAAIIDGESSLTTGHIIGFIIRYFVLFIIGGTIAYLHTDENKPYKVFQLGIAAPALITSFITANGINSAANNTVNGINVETSFHIISPAYADDNSIFDSHKSKIKQQAYTYQEMFFDIFNGFTGSAYGHVHHLKRKVLQTEPEDESESSDSRPSRPSENISN